MPNTRVFKRIYIRNAKTIIQIIVNKMVTTRIASASPSGFTRTQTGMASAIVSAVIETGFCNKRLICRCSRRWNNQLKLCEQYVQIQDGILWSGKHSHLRDYPREKICDTTRSKCMTLLGFNMIFSSLSSLITSISWQIISIVGICGTFL